MGGGPGEQQAGEDWHVVPEEDCHAASEMVPGGQDENAKRDEDDGEDEEHAEPGGKIAAAELAGDGLMGFVHLFRG